MAQPSGSNLASQATLWQSSVSDVSYRLSSWPSLSRVSQPQRPSRASKGTTSKPVEPQEAIQNSEYIHIQPEQRVFESLQKLIRHFPVLHIWKLSLVGCSLHFGSNGKVLNPLCQLAALGLLDLSCTDVTIQSMQSAVKKVQILCMYLVNCQSLSRLSWKELRGIIAAVLPNVWSLDGIFIGFQERTAWCKLSEEPNGHFSSLVQRYSDPGRRAFHPRIENDEGADGNSHVYRQELKWSSKATQYLEGIPTTDQWGKRGNTELEREIHAIRAKRIVSEFQDRITSVYPATIFSGDQVAYGIHLMVGNLGDTGSDDTPQEVDRRVCFLLLLLSSLVAEIPLDIVQTSLEGVFGNQLRWIEGIRQRHWTNISVTPLGWSIRERVEYMGLLLSMTVRGWNGDLAKNVTASEFPAVDAKSILNLLLDAMPLLWGVLYSGDTLQDSTLPIISLGVDPRHSRSAQPIQNVHQPEKIQSIARLLLHAAPILIHQSQCINPEELLNLLQPIGSIMIPFILKYICAAEESKNGPKLASDEVTRKMTLAVKNGIFIGRDQGFSPAAAAFEYSLQILTAFESIFNIWSRGSQPSASRGDQKQVRGITSQNFINKKASKAKATQ